MKPVKIQDKQQFEKCMEFCRDVLLGEDHWMCGLKTNKHSPFLFDNEMKT